MRKLPKYTLSALAGAAYAALPAALACLILRNLAALFGLIGSLIPLDEAALEYGAQILSNFKTSPIAAPWLFFLPAGALTGILAAWLPLHRGKKLLLILLGALLLLPLTLAALWLTSVNDILVGNLLQSVLPMLPHLL